MTGISHSMKDRDALFNSASLRWTVRRDLSSHAKSLAIARLCVKHLSIIKRVQECSQWACPICIMWSCIICTGRMGLSGDELAFHCHITIQSPYSSPKLQQMSRRADEFISLIRARCALVGYSALVLITNALWLNITLSLSSFFRLIK